MLLMHMEEDDELFARDLAASAPTPAVYAAAATAAIAGVVFVFLGIQTRAIVGEMTALGEATTLTMFGSGVLLVVLATQLLRMRVWAAVVATAASGVLTLASVGWLVLSLANGLFSLLAGVSPFTCIAAAVSGALSISTCERASAAHHRMRERHDRCDM
jgi:hypothetical protein